MVTIWLLIKPWGFNSPCKKTNLLLRLRFRIVAIAAVSKTAGSHPRGFESLNRSQHFVESVYSLIQFLQSNFGFFMFWLILFVGDELTIRWMSYDVWWYVVNPSIGDGIQMVPTDAICIGYSFLRTWSWIPAVFLYKHRCFWEPHGVWWYAKSKLTRICVFFFWSCEIRVNLFRCGWVKFSTRIFADA